MLNIFNFNLLHVEGYTKSKPAKSDPLHRFTKIILPFKASTCARHVYFFPPLKGDNNNLKLLYKSKENKHRTWEILKGPEAYEFLLSWMVGSKTKKYCFNDRFILGKVRKSWTNFSTNGNTKETAKQYNHNPNKEVFPFSSPKNNVRRQLNIYSVVLIFSVFYNRCSLVVDRFAVGQFVFAPGLIYNICPNEF